MAKMKLNFVGVAGKSLMSGLDKIFVLEGANTIQVVEMVIEDNVLVIRPCDKHGKPVEAGRQDVSLSNMILSEEAS